MLAVVVPARNQEHSIRKVLYNLHAINPDLVILVINGCTDNTLAAAQLHKKKNVRILHFEEPLGIDVPRAVGALYAFRENASRVLFVDGDMIGSFQKNLLELDAALKNGVHMALTNCYPYIKVRQPLTSTMLQFRARVNHSLGKFTDLGLASPSHGPHGVSRQIFNTLSIKELAIPPVSLVLSHVVGLNIKVATALPHASLGSPAKGNIHSEKIVATLIGDCLEALCIIDNKPRCRNWRGKEYDGYHHQRRLDIVEELIRHDGPWPVLSSSPTML